MGKWGLSTAEAERSRAKYGDNCLKEQAAEGFGQKLKQNLADPMIKILGVALAINILFAVMGQAHWYESAGIALAIILATLVSTFSEYNNENAFRRLQEEAARIKCKVFRDGQITELAIDELVVGDCVLMQPGDKIPADGILVEGGLQCDQSALNGEAKEAAKKVAPTGYQRRGEIDFLDPFYVFRGAVVCAGNAVMQVDTVGDCSVYGQLAAGLQSSEDLDSPLKLKLKHLAGTISKFGYTGGIAIALALLFQNIVIKNGFNPAAIKAYCADYLMLSSDVLQAVILAVIIIVMAVPEGLPLMIAIVSARNMRKMLNDNVLVRKLVGIETAGSLNILFSDKTGTITKGLLEVVAFVDGDGREYQNCREMPPGLSKLIALSCYCNNEAFLSEEAGRRQALGGNMTDRAVLRFVEDCACPVNLTTVGTIPFSSENKFSAAQICGDYELTLVKGAPEKIIPQCMYYYDDKGQKQPFDKQQLVEKQVEGFAAKAIRVLALAVCEEPLGFDVLPEGAWTFLGLMGIRDDVREEAVAAISEVRSAGVQVVMITGDRPDTAGAIAKEAGLLTSADDLVLTSGELAKLADEEVQACLPRLRVVARALPNDKSRLVRLSQGLGLVTGMTGDGVNDSPALKQADVGFAMGSGTEVAKEAGDIVIMDDNFSSIVKAILYGRTIFNSIRKFIIFQLTINVAAVLVTFLMPLLGEPNPLSITQILWVNLIMDTLAALAFGGEPALKRYMREKPKKRDEKIVNKYMWCSIITAACWILAVSLFLLKGSWAAGFFRPGADYLLTGYFAFFVFVAVANGFNARTQEINIAEKLTRNPDFLRIMALVVVIQILMVYWGGAVLRCYGLLPREWVLVLSLALTIIPVDMLKKALWRKTQKR